MKKIILLATSALILSACSDSNSVNESVLRKGIENFAAEQGVCLSLPLDILDANGRMLPPEASTVGSPSIVLTDRNIDGKRINKDVKKYMDMLVDEDIYREADKKSVSEGDVQAKTVTYELTPKGSSLLQYGPRGPVVCTRGLKVTKINWFTEPTPANGMTVTKVSYRAEVVPEKWMKKLLKENPSWSNVAGEQSYNATLVKTNDGWHDIRHIR